MDERTERSRTLYRWEGLVPGAFILAHQAFFAATGLPIAELPTGQGLVIKLAD